MRRVVWSRFKRERLATGLVPVEARLKISLAGVNGGGVRGPELLHPAKSQEYFSS